MKLAINKILSFSIVLVLLISMTANAEQKKPKLVKPAFRTEGVYLVQKGKKFTEKIKTNTKNAVIYYSVNGGKKKKYNKSIKIDESVVKITAISTKKGFEDSDKAIRKYSYSFASPPVPYHGIKVKNLKRGINKIRGTLNFNSKIPVYIKLIVKTSNGKVKKYNTKVKKSKWSISLKKSLKKGDKITISAYTKHYAVHLSKEKNNIVDVMEEYIPNNTWKSVKKKL